MRAIPFSPSKDGRCGRVPVSPRHTPPCNCVWCSDRVGLGVVAGGVNRWDGVGFDASALHVGNELVGDLGQYVLSQPGHAQHMVAGAVHVVSEWDKLGGHIGEECKAATLQLKVRKHKN